MSVLAIRWFETASRWFASGAGPARSPRAGLLQATARGAIRAASRYRQSDRHHSRIGGPIAQNLHVPSDRFTEAWEGLVKGDVLGVSPYLGVAMDENAKDCKLGRITFNGPAAKAGVLVGDVITKFGGKPVSSYDDMVKMLATAKPLSEVTLEVKRGKDVKEIKVKIGYRQN